LSERPPSNLICLCLAHDGRPVYFTGPETEQYYEEAIGYAIFAMLCHPLIRNG